MAPHIILDFIVIDDDALNNFICRKVIQMVISKACVKTFTDPEQGLDYLLATYPGADARHAILFLDISMPFLN